MMAWLKLLILPALLLLSAIENDAAGHQAKPSGHVKTLGSRGNEPTAERDSSDSSYVEYVDGGPLGSLYDFLISHRLQRFCKLLRKANVDDLLVEMGIFTIFAPNDGSFAFLPGGILEELEKNQRLLREFVLYHIVEGDLQTTSITNDLVVESLQRIPLRFNIYDNAITVSGAEILEGDLKFDIGRVHIIDRPLYPYAKTDILSYLKENHFEFYQLIVRAGLSEYISSGTFSIFVPDDKSFDYLSIDLKDALRLNESLAYRLVLNHVLPGTFFVRGLNAGTKMQSVGGEDFTFTQRRGLTFVNGFPVLQSDIPVTNGVIHVTNRVILPEGIDSDCHCKPLDTSRPSGTGTQRPGPGRGVTTRRPIQANEITSSPGRRPPPGLRPSPGLRPLPGSVTRPTIPPGLGQTPRPRPGLRPGIPTSDEVKHGDRPSGGGDQDHVPPIPGQRPGIRPVPGIPDVSSCRPLGERPTIGDRRPLCPGSGTTPTNVYPRPPGTQYPGTPFRPGTGGQVTPPPGIKRPTLSTGRQDCRLPGERPRTGDRRPLCPSDATQDISQPPYPPSTGIRPTTKSPYQPGRQKPGQQVTPQVDCRAEGERVTPGDTRPLCEPAVTFDTDCRSPGTQAIPGDRRPLCSTGEVPLSGCRSPSERVSPGDRRPLCGPGGIPVSGCRLPGERTIPGDRRPLCQTPQIPESGCRLPEEPIRQGDTRPLCQPGQEEIPTCRFPGERAIPGDRRPLCPQGLDTTRDCRYPEERVQPGDRRPLCSEDPSQNCRAPGQHAIPDDRRPLCPPGTTPISDCRAPGERAIPGDRRPICSQDVDVTQDCRMPGKRVQPGDRRPLCPGVPSQNCRAPGERAIPGDRRPLCPPDATPISGCRAPGERAMPGDRRPICPQDIYVTSDCRLPGERAIPGDRRPLCPPDTTPLSGCRAPGERAIPGDRRPICPQDIDVTSDCRLPGERAQPGDRRQLCPEDQSQNCRALGERAIPGDRRPLCPPGTTPISGCRIPGERAIPGDRRPLCPQDIDVTPDCRLPGEQIQPGDRRPLCPEDPSRNCRAPGEHTVPGDRRPLCQPGTPTSGCRGPGERPIPGDRRPICPQDIGTTSDCRLPGEQIQPGDRRPLCPEDPSQNCRAPGERTIPGDRRPMCSPDTTPISGCRAPGERAIPGDRRPLCPQDVDVTPDCRLPGEQIQPGDRRPLCPEDPSRNCRAPGEHAVPGDRRPLCRPGTPTSGCRGPGERPIPGDRRPICPQDIGTTLDCRHPEEQVQPGDQRPLCPEDPSQNCRAPGERAIPGDRRPLCPPGTTPISGCRAPGERAIPGDRRPICPHDVDITPHCRLPGERVQPGDRRPLCQTDQTPISDCRRSGEHIIPGDMRPLCPPAIQPVPDCRPSSERAAPGDRRSTCPPDQIIISDCRNPGDNSIHGDRRPLCSPGITSLPDCRAPGERFTAGDNRPLCPRDQVPSCRMPGEVFIPGDRRPQCPPRGPGTISTIGPTRGPFTQRPTAPQPPGSVSSPYPGSRPGPRQPIRGQTTRRPGHSTRFPGLPDDNSVDGFTDYYPEDYEPSVQRPGQPPRLQPPSQIPGRVPGPPSREQTPNEITDQPPRRPGQIPGSRPGHPSWQQASSQRPVRPTQASRRTTPSSRTPDHPSGPGTIPGRPGQRPGVSSPAQFTTRAPVFPPRRPGGQTSHATKGQPYDPARHPPQRRPTGRFPSLPPPPAQNLSPSAGGRPTRSQIRNSSPSSSSGSPSWTPTSTRRTHQANRQKISNCLRRGDRVTPETQSLPLCPTNEENGTPCQRTDQPYDPADPRPVCESNVDEDFYSICRNPEAPFDPADTRPVCSDIRDQAACRQPGQPFNPTDNRPLCKANADVPSQPSASQQPQGGNLPGRNPPIDRTPGQHERRTNQQTGHTLSPPGQPTTGQQFNQGTRNSPHRSQPPSSQQSGRPGSLENQHPTQQPQNHPIGSSGGGGRTGGTSAPGSSANRPGSQQQGHRNTNPQRPSPTFPGSTQSVDSGTTAVGDDSPRSLYEIVEEPALLIRGHPVQLTRIFQLFQKAGLEHILSDPGPHTIFLPSDDAFYRLPQGVIEQLEQNPELLRQVLLYHITTSEVLPSGVDESYSVPSLQGNQLLITMVNGGRLVLISGSKAVAVTRANNGIFYVINQFLYPLPQDDIVSALHSRPDLSQATTFSELSGIQDLLQDDKPYTMFAPTDNAFNQLPQAVIQELSQNVTALRRLLMGHLIEGAHYGREFLTGATYPSLAGGRLNLKVVSFGYQVNDVNIKSPEIVTGTGVIHVIDEVLISPEIQLLIDRLQNSIDGALSPDPTEPSSRIGNTGGRTHSVLSAGHRQNSMSHSGRPGSQTVRHTSNTYTSSHESTFTQNGPMTTGHGSTTTRQGSSFSGQGFTSSQHGTSVTRQGLGQGSPMSSHGSIPNSPVSYRSGHVSPVSSHGSIPNSPGSQRSGFTSPRHGTSVSGQGFGQGSPVPSHGSSSPGSQGSGFTPGSSGPQVPGHGSTYNGPNSDVSRQGTLNSGSVSPASVYGSESSGYGSDGSRHEFSSGSHGSLPGSLLSGGHDSLPGGQSSSGSGHNSHEFPEHGTSSSSPEHYSGVAEQASTIGLSRFAALITSTGISDKVADGGTYTVFAPTDSALNSLTNMNSDQLKIVLLYHILPQKLSSRSFQNDETASTLLEGKRIRFNVYRGGHMMTALGVPIEQPNNASGTVNLVPVDHVLMPPEGDLMKIIQSMPNLQEFAKAVKDYHLSWMLSGEGSWTLFAPSDTALQALSEEDRKNILENRQNFTDFLKSHLLRGTLFTTGLEDGTQKQTENRKPVTFTVQDGAVAINSVPVSYPDVPATNGVLHIIDQCL